MAKMSAPTAPSFVVLPFRNVMQHWNDGLINSGNDQTTPDINLGGFLISISRVHTNQLCTTRTWVSLSTFARWQQNYVSPLLARGRHCGAERAIRQTLPRISSISFFKFYVSVSCLQRAAFLRKREELGIKRPLSGYAMFIADFANNNRGNFDCATDLICEGS